MNNMENNNNFDDIRPYRDDEIPAAMERIAASPTFPLLASYVFPERNVEEVRSLVRTISTVDAFQSTVMTAMNKRIISDTMKSFTYSGLENLSRDKSYLFIGNHRDIVLDSSLMQGVLHSNGYTTSEITFGANLMQGQLIIDIGKANKMFRVERPGSDIREFYRASIRLSCYIRQAIRDNGHSVWIAQRNGRTKDGNDQTDQGIIKMFAMSDAADKVTSMAELNIAPVAISYEWEPCDVLKALELYEKNRMGRYVKKPGEDINSILTGMLQPKGHVHLEFCRPLQHEELQPMDGLTLGDFHRAVAALIDSRIHSSYRLTANNYIAHDLRYGRTEYSDRYSDREKSAFVNHLAQLEQYSENADVEALADIMLGIYSNPVDSAVG
jgi:hypothetical protein